MKITIKLATSFRNTKNGFPIVLDLVDKSIRKRKTVGYSHPEYWDFENSKPLKQHPDYYNLLPNILDYKAKIKKIEFGNVKTSEAVVVLFGRKTPVQSELFFDACLKYCDKSRNGILYKTVLNSFDLFYPNIRTADITQKKAVDYMNAILKDRKPNGVHTYLRTLNALFNKVSDKDNPFKGIRPKKQPTPNTALSVEDVRKLITTRTIVNKFDSHNTNTTVNYYRYYWMLMFYLGGIDMVDLAHLRYDKHVIDDRIQFTRHKGGTNAFINNRIFPIAQRILKHFDCFPYLVPIYLQKDYSSFVGNYNKRFKEGLKDLKLTRTPLTKSARYTFINFALQTGIPETVTMEIVGHQQQNTHSIYKESYPLTVRDEAHLKIIEI